MTQFDFDMSSLELPMSVSRGIRFSSFFDVDNFEAAYKYRPHDNDTVLCTYPKSGSTWTKFIMCNLLHYDEPSSVAANTKVGCPYLEMFGTKGLKPGSFYSIHLPFNEETFNPNAKYVFVMRNPRDVAVSYYHFTTLVPPGVPGLPKDAYWFPRFAELFVKGQVWYGDYMEHHRGWLDGFRKYGRAENTLIVVYEKMKRDPRGELVRIANFLGGRAAELVNDEKAVETILERTCVDSMKKTVNPSLRATIKKMCPTADIPDNFPFVRKGTVGDHANYFTPEISKMFDEYIASNPRNKEIMDWFDI